MRPRIPKAYACTDHTMHGMDACETPGAECIIAVRYNNHVLASLALGYALAYALGYVFHNSKPEHGFARGFWGMSGLT